MFNHEPGANWTVSREILICHVNLSNSYIYPADNFCVYTSVCGEDTSWIDGYLIQMNYHRIPFAMHFDRVTDSVKQRVIEHPYCVAYTEQNCQTIEFDETHKQAILDKVIGLKFDWAMSLDIDERLEENFWLRWVNLRSSELIKELDTVDIVNIRYLHLWNDVYHYRTDGPFAIHKRASIIRLRKDSTWTFTTKVTNGPKLLRDGKVFEAEYASMDDLIVFHHGLMEPERRLFHKDRWDRIYTKAVGNNPYGFWKYATDETIEPQLSVTLQKGVTNC